MHNDPFDLIRLRPRPGIGVFREQFHIQVRAGGIYVLSFKFYVIIREPCRLDDPYDPHEHNEYGKHEHTEPDIALDPPAPCFRYSSVHTISPIIPYYSSIVKRNIL